MNISYGGVYKGHEPLETGLVKLAKQLEDIDTVTFGSVVTFGKN